MLRKTDGIVEWLEFELFADCPRLKHGIFLKHGGVSPPPFQSLNFGLTQGDKPEHVIENKKRALSALGLKELYSSIQTHGKKIQEVNCHPIVHDCDGLMTEAPHKALLVQHADCQATIFYDPIRNALALIHCGWRGSVLNIYKEAVANLIQNYQCDPQNILVGISPSLGPHAAEFRNFKVELPSSFWKFQIKPTYFDFWEISRWQLEECGILPHHIQIAEICTYSETEDFFSYRRAKVSGRHATIAALL